ncbi:MAG TPA: response regulator transcription factor [Ktedonobacteraceae bacterium]|nr:response regulator transcription factor [Ktedonobacteraceae bacterium]
MSSELLRVLLVDDHPLVRNGLRALLASVPGMMVAGEATSGEEAIKQATELQPDIILMDLHMPGLNGVEATRHIMQTHPHIGILVLTMLEDDASVFAAMRAGARGYLLKGADQADVLRAIEAAAHGEAIFSPPIAQRLMQYFANMQPTLPQAAFPDLTEREREILGLIALGKSNSEIAEELVLSPKTVSNHVSNIFSKLQVVDRAQAVLRARQAGLG